MTTFFKELYNNSYFEAGRSPRKRSLLSVNEHFEDKPDAKRALLGNFFLLYFPNAALTKDAVYPRIESSGTQTQVHHIITTADMTHEGNISQHLRL